MYKRQEYDLAPEFSAWLAEYEYRDRYLSRPERLWDDGGNVRGLEEYLVSKIAEVTASLTSNDVLAPVSYTHLDVYKRQRKGRIRIRWHTIPATSRS